MPDAYIALPIDSDSNELVQLSFDFMEANVPGWTPNDGQLDTWILNASAEQAAEVRTVASDVPAAIFKEFGATLMGIPSTDATIASVPVTITAKDNAGYTIPAGYAAGVRDSSGILYGFVTAVDVVIPNGSTATGAGAVTMYATEAGADPSGLGGAAQPMELLTAIESVVGVVMTAATSGGVDAEEDTDYLNRLSRDLALQAPRPILPQDFASFALNNTGVGRALAIDGYDALAATYGNERTITVAVATDEGLTVGAPIKTAVQTDLDARRETNFVVYVVDPTYTTIDVQFDATAYPGYDAAGIQPLVVAALEEYLSPLLWGQPAGAEGDYWFNNDTVRQLDLAVVVGSVLGIKDVNSITLRTGAGAYGTADVALAGVAPLPLAGSITGTVV